MSHDTTPRLRGAHSTTTWQPILLGSEAAEALAVVDEIAAALRAMPTDALAAAAGPSLSQGTSGLALFFAELGEATDDAASLDHALALVDSAIETAARHVAGSTSLYGGAVGVGWVIELLAGRLFDAGPDDEPNDVDDLVDERLAAPWKSHFDVVSGIVGTGVYVLQRLPRPSAQRALYLIVERLAEMAEHTPDGITWRSTRAILPPTPSVTARLARFPDGYYDLGAAHGVAGVVAFLAAAVLAGEADAKELLEGSTRWLLAQHRADAKDGAYPFLYGPGTQPAAGGRAAWCYGDPSVAIGLLAAGRALGDVALIDEARAITVAAASRPVHESGVIDACLCHGSSGLAHVCNRFAQATGDERLAELARRWFRHTLDARLDGAGVAGFPMVQRSDDGSPPRREAVAGVLEGAAGVGLALLAATSDVEPSWDALLLLGLGS
jgi:lantibiotic modifying enzyme